MLLHVPHCTLSLSPPNSVEDSESKAKAGAPEFESVSFTPDHAFLI